MMRAVRRATTGAAAAATAAAATAAAAATTRTCNHTAASAMHTISWSAIRPAESAAAASGRSRLCGAGFGVAAATSAAVAAPLSPCCRVDHAAAAAAVAASRFARGVSTVAPRSSAPSHTHPSPTPDHGPRPLHLSPHARVLLLTKTPRYEHEKNSTGLAGSDLDAELRKLGFVSDRLVSSYERHMAGVAQLQRAMQRHGLDVHLKHVDAATHADLDGVQLVVAAGGDGTMLKAAALLGCPNETDHDGTSSVAPIPPIVGVNTDPENSSGVLCAFSLDGPDAAEGVVSHLLHSPFVRMQRSRIQITLVDKSGQAHTVGQYACNDVVVAERDPGRPIVYELTVGEEGIGEVQRSSGVLVCTGTGSTAWMSTAAGIHPEQVAAVLKAADHVSTPSTAREIADRINSKLLFGCSSPLVEFFVREPLRALPAAGGITEVEGRTGYQQRHGWADQVAVRSLGWDAVISIDGIKLIQLPKGTTAVLRIGKRPGAPLTVLKLADAAAP